MTDPFQLPTVFVWAVRSHPHADTGESLALFEAHTDECARAGNFPTVNTVTAGGTPGSVALLTAVEAVQAAAGFTPYGGSTYTGRCLRDVPRPCGPVILEHGSDHLEIDAAFEPPRLRQRRRALALLAAPRDANRERLRGMLDAGRGSDTDDEDTV